MKKPVTVLTRTYIQFVIVPVIFLVVFIIFASRQMDFSQTHFTISPTIAINDSIAGKLYKMKPRSIFTFCEMLHDENWEIREQAALALGKTKDYRAVEPLIIALRDKDPGVRWTAAWALGEIGNKKAFEPLLTAGTDPDNETTPEIDTWIMLERILKEKASAKRSGNTYEGSIFSGVDIQREAVRSLFKIDRKEAKKRLIPLIEKEKRAGVLAAMELNDCSILGDLLRLLEVFDSDAPESWRLIQDIETALQRMACPELIQTYLFGKLFAHEEQVIRQVVKGMDPNTVLSSALPALQNQNLKVRKRALDLLYSFWDVQVKIEAVRLLDDKDPEIRNSALRILAVHKDPSLNKFYKKKLQDRSREVRETAAESLLRMGDLRGIELLLSAKSSCYNAECLVQWLGELGNEEARRILLGFLGNWNSKDASTCSRAYYAALKLGELKEKRAMPHLVRMLRGGNEKDRKAARTALIEMGDTRFLSEVLSELGSTVSLKSSQHYMQREYLDALQNMATPHAAAQLAKMFQLGPHWQDRSWSMAVLDTFERCFSDPLVPVLQDQMKNPNISIRIRAAEILGNSRNRRALEALAPALHDQDWRIRKIALDGLGTAMLITKPQLLQFIQKEQNWLTKSFAIAILPDYQVDPAEIQTLLKKGDMPFFIRHQLTKLDKEFVPQHTDAAKSLPLPDLPSFIVVNENGISQMEYNGPGNEFKTSQSSKLTGYRHLVRSDNFFFVTNDQAIARLDHKLQPDKSIELNRIGSCAAFNNTLYISADGYLVILDENLNILGRFSLGIYDYSGKRKNAHDILVSGNYVYMLDNISHPIFTIKIDVGDPKQPKLAQETEIVFINHHLDAQWIAPKQNEWQIIQSSNHMGASIQWLLKFSLISGKLKDRVLLFRDIVNTDSWRRINGWIEVVDPHSPEWMVIWKDGEYFLGRLSMETGELLKQGLLPLGERSDFRSRDDEHWGMKRNGDLIFIFNDFQIWVIRIGENPEILVYQEFPEKILDIAFTD